MKFSERWLREWVDPPVTTAALADQLTMAGLEVEGITDCRTGVTGVVAAHVTQVSKHPAADSLSVCSVNAGQGDTHTVVCGAPNVRAGGIYPYARVGVELPGVGTIQQMQIRGVDSDGMLCSAAELGLGDTNAGLMELEAGTTPGLDLETCLKLDDRIIELSLTPNRGDCLSILGVAREVAVINNIEFKPLPITPVAPAAKRSKAVHLHAPAACPRYVSRIITGVDINRPSPLWLIEKLRRSGIRSINPVVDVSNYVMLELGQPLHAFDHDLLQGDITVRLARAGEQLTTLDGAQLELTPETLVIADDARPIAMAGIMGGQDTGISATTSTIFLESAYFAPAAIMGRPRYYGLYTDSSHRFERGVDFELQVLAAERATRLILDLCGGSAGTVLDTREKSAFPKPVTIGLRAKKIEDLLGVRIEPAEICSILRRLGIQVGDKAGGWDILVPSYRFDLSLEADLVEEIARIHGYERIPSAPIDSKLQIIRRDNSRNIKELQEILVNRGYHEVITYSFVDADLQNKLFQAEVGEIALLNPISSAMNVMRLSLWPGLLGTLLYNMKRQQQQLRVFEFGRVFCKQGANIEQELKIAGLSFGNISTIQWDNNNISSSFYIMKSDIEALVMQREFGQSLNYQALNHPALHPGQSAEILYKNQLIGIYGALHPRLLQALEIPGPVMLFELDYQVLCDKPIRKYKNISRFPAVKRDISILVGKDIPVDSILNAIHAASPNLLCNLELFDVYHGEGIDILKKSLALSLTFQASSHTLTDEEAEGEVENILAALKFKFDGKLRE